MSSSLDNRLAEHSCFEDVENLLNLGFFSCDAACFPKDTKAERQE